MSGGGDGGNFFDPLIPEVLTNKNGNFFQNAFNDLINVGVNYASLGNLGFKDGSIGTKNGAITGTVGKAAVEGIKDVTGAKAAEEANKAAREQFEQQKFAAEQERQNTIMKKGLEQIQMSQLAGAAQRRSGGGNSVNGGANLLGSAEKDFLGL